MAMTGEHERFEQQAVGHVLGGLDAAAAAEFRDHLLGCRACRSRVAELRGIAADLAAAERDERARSAVRTELPRRVDDGEEHEPSVSRIGVRQVTIAAIVVAVMAASMGFWNLHLRTQAAMYGAVAERQAAALDVLASGVPLEAELTGEVGAMVAVTDADVAFALARLPAFDAGDVLVVWLVGGALDDPTPALYARAPQFADGQLAVAVEHLGAAELTIRRERGEPGTQPGGQELIRVELPGAAASDGD
jgi:hypothetical protein